MATSYTKPGYTIDRWVLSNGAHLDLESDGIALSGDLSTQFPHISQTLDFVPSTVKNVITASILVYGESDTNAVLSIKDQDGGNGLFSKYFTCTGQTQLITQTTEIPEKSEVLRFNILLNNPDTTSQKIKIYAAKLELGPVQTLAHQDADGNWVLNDPPPNFQQELAKCQRYQKRYFYQYTGIGSGFAQSESQAVVLVNNVFMRDELPSISFSGLGLVSSNHSGTNAISVSNITPANAMGGMAVIVNTDGGLTKGESLILQIRENDGFFMFDANL